MFYRPSDTLSPLASHRRPRGGLDSTSISPVAMRRQKTGGNLQLGTATGCPNRRRTTSPPPIPRERKGRQHVWAELLQTHHRVQAVWNNRQAHTPEDNRRPRGRKNGRRFGCYLIPPTTGCHAGEMKNTGRHSNAGEKNPAFPYLSQSNGLPGSPSGSGPRDAWPLLLWFATGLVFDGRRVSASLS